MKLLLVVSKFLHRTEKKYVRRFYLYSPDRRLGEQSHKPRGSFSHSTLKEWLSENKIKLRFVSEDTDQTRTYSIK